MTISSTTSKVSYNGSGSVGPFTIPYKFSRNADIVATKVSTTGVETVLTLTTHYTLTGAGDPSGGTLTLVTALASGEKLVIKRSPSIVQEADYVENAAFPAESHEAALDLLTMICQSLQEQIGRAVLYPVSTSDEDIRDSSAFLAATQAYKDAAHVSEQNAAGSAGQAAASASQAAQSALAAGEIAAIGDGLVKVSAGDACGRSLSAKLLAGDGLAEGIENPGGDEALRLAVALAGDPGLEFAAGLLRVKAGAGLVRTASGLAADAGVTPGKLLQLDDQGRMPAVVGAYTRQQYAVPVTVAPTAGAVTLDAELHQEAEITSTQALTMNAPTKGVNGMRLFLRLYAATALAISWNAVFKANADVELPTAHVAGKGIYLDFRYDGASWVLMGKVVEV